MSQSQMFRKLGAPLANSRWSWGALRASDNTMFLRVWADRTVKVNNKFLIQLSHHEAYRDMPDDLGHQERIKHIELVKSGASCFLVMCRAVDAKVTPRKVLSFIEQEVFPTGMTEEIEGETWIEMLPRVPIETVAEKTTTT